ncbi:redox-sensing transcriptional repressor Rex [Cellulomonas sp. KH9]|uniref:redox-sensing transcriptional repressor Rex n=1 Tax=Cellulomonas sp. KH9 TaxID=1855324 RepID=UPI0008DF9417|nr:redox-sensing transcriptional repressor Rex [Cellulomonas sp. KH9]SFJ78111.1 redox-sensing transcriptional repressor [Cellulomonas sp. KH9]
MDGRRSAARRGADGRAGRDGQPVPSATVGRLPGYLRALEATAAAGAVLTSSDELAERAGVTPAQLRKDLSYLGSYGRRGVGYDVAHLREQITVALGLADVRRVLLVGVGNLGHALANYAGIAERGFVLVGLVDADPAVVGTTVAGLVVEPADDLAEVVARTGATIAVLTTPAAVAQQVCDALVAAGVVGVLTFAPCALRVPPHVDVRAVDVASELQILAFHDRARSAGGGVS